MMRHINFINNYLMKKNKKKKILKNYLLIKYMKKNKMKLKMIL